MMTGERWEAERDRRRPWLVIVALVVVAGAAMWLGRSEEPQTGLNVSWDAPGTAVSPEPQATQLRPAPGEVVRGSWAPMAPAPLTGRALASMTWTGDEAVVWGGLGAEPLDDGARYDPRADRWTTLPAAPLEARFAHGAVWTGEELVVAGGSDTPLGDGVDVLLNRSDAAAFDPRTNGWHVLPPLPFSTGTGHLFSVDGSVYAVSADVRPISVAVLYPGAVQWTALPVPRPGGTRGPDAGSLEAGVAAGELLLWNRRGEGAGVAIDLSQAGEWRKIERAPTPLPDFETCCVVVASDASVDGVDVIAYDRARALWRPLGEGTPAELVIGEDHAFLLRLHASSGAVDLRRGVPLRLPAAPLSPRYGAATVWAGDRLLAWGGRAEVEGRRHADGAVFLPRL